MEDREIADEVIAREDAHDDIGAITVGDVQGRQRDGGRGVSGARLDDKGVCVVEFGQVRGDRLAQCLVAHDQTAVAADHGQQALDGLRDHDAIAPQAHELFGTVASAQGPEAGA